ncbi:hypothetical protein GCM10010468_15020 [Actinocorallia longicatena]|uniref:Uncharacterized protein n=1 Tax=Actinocorallia longicatena TaxID=111803 RepID=A0ABP6Q595_9ACTN
MHIEFTRAEMNARTERYQAEAAHQVVRTPRFRWFRSRKHDQKIGRLRPRGVAG